MGGPFVESGIGDPETMWTLLSDTRQAKFFAELGETFLPIQHLVEQLARRPYANKVYAFTSVMAFNLTMAQSFQDADNREIIGVDFDPKSGLFYVGYGISTWNPPRDFALRITTEINEAVTIIDEYAASLLSCQP